MFLAGFISRHASLLLEMTPKRVCVQNLHTPLPRAPLPSVIHKLTSSKHCSK